MQLDWEHRMKKEKLYTVLIDTKDIYREYEVYASTDFEARIEVGKIFGVDYLNIKTIKVRPSDV